MKTTKPKLKMPEGFPRLFIGDGKTPFKGPAMVRYSDDEWIDALGMPIPGGLVFADANEYALPALPRKVSASKAAKDYSGKRDLQLAFMAGARWAMKRGEG